MKHGSILAQLDGLKDVPLDVVERDKRRQELQTVLQQTETDLFGRADIVEQQMPGLSFSLVDIARGLPAQSVSIDFVSYFRFDYESKTNRWKEARYAAYLTFPLESGATNAVVAMLDLGEAMPIDPAVETITKRMAAGQFATSDLSNAVQRVSDLVYGPLAKHLTDVAHLIVCPDGQLSRLPFEMLRHGGKFLVEEKTISYVGSGREIVRLAQAPSPKAKVHTAKSLVMGNPDFDLDLKEVQASSTAGSAASLARSPADAKQDAPQLARAAPALHALSRDYRGFEFAPLPGAEVEALSVAGLLGADAVLRLGANARESDLKKVISPRVLHLATRGFFLSDQEFQRTNASGLMTTGPFAARRASPGEDWENPMVRCGLALAGANRASPECPSVTLAWAGRSEPEAAGKARRARFGAL